MYGNIIDLP